MTRRPIACLLALAPALAGCDMAAAIHKCGWSGCAGDARISAEVRDMLFARADVFANDISVQTLDRVVYLSGLVDTGVERAEIVAAVGRVSGVERIVDSLVIRNDPAL